MADPIVRDFPLFPLGIVALPHELVPLHIFEERYRTMIEECLESESEFGIVWPPRRASDRWAARARSPRCSSAWRTAAGEHPQRAAPDRSGSSTAPRAPPLSGGHVEFVDRPAETPDLQGRGDAHEAYAELVAQATDRRPERRRARPLTAYQMAATVDFGHGGQAGPARPAFRERPPASLVTRLFRAALKRLDFVERAQEQARSNGRVRSS